MNCATHPENAAAAYCRSCGKALCERCERPIRGVVYCEDCVANSMEGTARQPKTPASCAQHPGTAASSYCRTCGKAICRECERAVRGVVYCEDCLAGRVQGMPAQAAATGVPHSAPKPGLAVFLAAILPFGVGQAYNGQYARGIVHLVVFSVLVWGADNTGSASSIFGIGIAAFYFYQIFDAHRSAHALAEGRPAPDPFGLDNLFGKYSGLVPVPSAPASAASAASVVSADGPRRTAAAGTDATGTAGESGSRLPTGAIVLIVLGVVFLLGHSGIMRFWIGSIWPLIFIAIGVALLVKHWEAITTRHCSLMGPAVMLTLGVLFLAQSAGRVRFARSFPLLLIVIGVVLLWQRASRPTIPAAPAAPGPVPSTALTTKRPDSDQQSGVESEVKGS